MSIFNNLFGYNLTNNNVDKTPAKVKVMLKSLCGMNIIHGSNIYKMLVPKRFYKSYIAATYNKVGNDIITPMEHTRIYGYLNPKYHAATSPRKRIR